MKKRITKGDIFAFLGLVLSALLTTLFTRITSRNDTRQAVAEILEEERKQIAEMEEKDAKEVNEGH